VKPVPASASDENFLRQAIALSQQARDDVYRSRAVRDVRRILDRYRSHRGFWTSYGR
jgi:hypothetical protein